MRCADGFCGPFTFLCIHLFSLMRVVLQRVSKASVVVNHATVGAISAGFLIFLGVGKEDSVEDVDWRVGRIAKLRDF